MKLWMHQSRGEGVNLYIENNGMMHLVYVLNTFGKQQIRVRKLDQPGNWTPKQMSENNGIELDKLLKAIQAEGFIDDPFSFTLENKRSGSKEYKVGMVREIQNPKPAKDKKSKKP